MNKPKKTAMSPIESQVMQKIKQGQIKMHSRYYYSLLTVLSLIGVVLIAVVLSYLISLASLWLRIQSASGQAYGARQNLTSLVNSFPWWAVLIAVLAIVALVILVKRIGSLYKIKLVYLIPAIVIIAVLLGFGLSYTQLPNTFKKQPKQLMCGTSDDVNCQPNGRGYRNSNN